MENSLEESNHRRHKPLWFRLFCWGRCCKAAATSKSRRLESRAWKMGSGDAVKRVPLVGEKIGSDDLEGVMNADAQPPPEHLVILVNGIIGSPEDWRYAADRFLTKLGRHAAIHRSANNASWQTFDGVDVMGRRLAKEVRDIIDRTPGVTKISFVAHSLGGLVARYAIAQLYCPPVHSTEHEDGVKGSQLTSKMTTVPAQAEFTIGGLQPENFITLATPHLGCRGTEQLPFLLGIEAFEKTASCCAHWFVGQTGKHLFLTDGSTSAQPLLRRMVTDCKEGQFISSLQLFKKRVAYANVVNDQMVGWRTSSIRRPSEMPEIRDEPVDPVYPHIVREEEPGLPAVEDLSAVNFRLPLGDVSKYAEDTMEEEIVSGLTQIPWYRVDVTFRGYQAHNLIQVKNPRIHYEGVDVIEHVLDKHFAAEHQTT